MPENGTKDGHGTEDRKVDEKNGNISEQLMALMVF
jgi:hypothetical protein